MSPQPWHQKLQDAASKLAFVGQAVCFAMPDGISNDEASAGLMLIMDDILEVMRDSAAELHGLGQYPRVTPARPGMAPLPRAS